MALDHDEIIRRGAANVGDALRGEPGIAISNDSAKGQNPIIRGRGKESIELLVDGIRFNSAQLGGAINVLLPQAKFVPGIGIEAGTSYDSASKGMRGTAVVNASSSDHAVMLGASLGRIDDYKSPNGALAGSHCRQPA